MKSELPKFCKDCKHFRQVIDTSPRCYRPEALLGYDLVHGFPIYTTCEAMRKQHCGKEAKLFL